MKEPKNFVKLFDLNVPKIEHFEYYINQLSKSQKYKNIRQYISLWEEVEHQIDDVWEYRKSKSNQIIEFIKNTNAYTEMCFDKNLLDFNVNKSIEYLEGLKYFSIDLRNANWVSLKKYDSPSINELGDNYSEFLQKFDLPKVFIHSKYLRQFIFGNVNPKKIMKVQRNLIQNVVEKYNKFLKVVGVRNDEVIFSFENFNEIQEIYQSLDQTVYKTKIYSVRKVEDFRIDTHYNIYGEVLNNELVGCDGHQFYLKFKQYITGEKIDIRDLYFKSAGKVAIWELDNLKIEIC